MVARQNATAGVCLLLLGLKTGPSRTRQGAKTLVQCNSLSVNSAVSSSPTSP